MRMDNFYYDKQGEPIEFEAWGKLFQDMDYRVVVRTDVPGGFVSTVWLGIDHSFTGGKPVLFETMVFKEGEEENYCERYCTEAEAVEGHARFVKMFS